jgi:rifampicin phosphotransferase
MPVDADEQTETHLKGIGCSPGQITGTARVLHGPEDFDQMQHGDVLVADITTPAWTPLFALAAGIVTNVGGTLSHGSISKWRPDSLSRISSQYGPAGRAI